MRFFSVLLVSLLAAACGDDVRRYTWGDASDAVAASYCAKAEECGFGGYSRCYKHSMHHLCELSGTCDNALENGAEKAANACTKAVDAMEVPDSCAAVFWGILPLECQEVLEHDPSRK